MRFADVAGLDQDARRRIYHQALLRYIGCNADTHLLAAHWGDENTLRRELHQIDIGNRAEFVELLVRALKRKFAGAPPDLELLYDSDFTKRGGKIVCTCFDENFLNMVPAEHVEGLYGCLDYYQGVGDPFSKS
jgi:hypothetical protein